MLKQSQEKLKLNYNKEVIDIVQFGSSIVAGKIPNDIDVAVIYNKIPLKEQLLASQEIKRQLERHFSLPIHINSYDYYSLFGSGNFARDSILFNGKSLIHNRYFFEIIGLHPRVQIKYNLSKLEKKDKVSFNYLLNGRNGEYGLLRKYNGKLVAPGIIEIYPEYEKIFLDAIKDLCSFEVKKVFVQK